MDANGAGDYITYNLPNVPAGQYTVVSGSKIGPGRGMFQLSIGGTNQGAVTDQYAAAYTYVEQNLGTVTFSSSGTKSFTFTVTGRNAAASAYTLAFDYFMLIPVN